MRLTNKIKIPAIIFISIALVLAAVFAILKVSGEKKSNIIKILPDEADVRIQDFVFTEVGQDDIRWEVRSKSAQYQKKLNLALFDQVHIKFTTQAGRVFILTGDEGRMLTDKKDVELKGHVVVTSDMGDRFTTDYLRYSDAEKKIYTDAPVMMESKMIKITGIGLSIFLNSGELKLSSGVRAKIN